MGATNGHPLDALPSFPSGSDEAEIPWNWRVDGFRDVLAHPVAAAALLQLVWAEGELADFDPKVLRREPPRQVGPDLDRAKIEMIWTAPCVLPGVEASERIHFIVKVQPTMEWLMSIHLMNDVALHGMQLLSEQEPPLPCPVPVVLYTGEQLWDAPLNASEVIARVGPESEHPELRYRVVDLGRLEVTAGTENLVELLAGVFQGASEAELLHWARALHCRLVALGDKHLEGLCFDLVRAMCKEKWPEENWKDCANMTEVVDVLEERTVTWPEKWKARYVAEGHAQGRAQGRVETSETMLSSLEKGVRARFGESVARSFGLKIEVARQADSAQGLEILDAICQCVMTSENAEQLLAGLESIRPKTA